LTELLCRALIKRDELVELGGARARVLSLAVKQVSSEDLRGREGVRKFAIRFLTPTFFRVHIPRAVRRAEKARVLPLPDPVHLFTNLYKRLERLLEARDRGRLLGLAPATPHP